MRMWLMSAGLGLMLAAQSAVAGTVLIVGDSISAAFGLDTRAGWVALLEKRLAQQGFDDKVVNASITGDTSANGLARLPAQLAAHKPDLVLLELGGNDGLRGMPVAQLQQNLASMIDLSRKAGPRYCCWACNCRPTTARGIPRHSPRSTKHSRTRKKWPWCRSCSKGLAAFRH